MLLGGIGMPCVMTPSSAAALSGVPVDRAGVGSAVLNSSRQVGGSVGIALMGAIVAHERTGGASTPEAFTHGLSVGLVVAAVIAFSGAALGRSARPLARRRVAVRAKPEDAPARAAVTSPLAAALSHRSAGKALAAARKGPPSWRWPH